MDEETGEERSLNEPRACVLPVSHVSTVRPSNQTMPGGRRRGRRVGRRLDMSNMMMALPSDTLLDDFSVISPISHAHGYPFSTFPPPFINYQSQQQQSLLSRFGWVDTVAPSPRRAVLVSSPTAGTIGSGKGGRARGTPAPMFVSCEQHANAAISPSRHGASWSRWLFEGARGSCHVNMLLCSSVHNHAGWHIPSILASRLLYEP